MNAQGSADLLSAPRPTRTGHSAVTIQGRPRQRGRRAGSTGTAQTGTHGETVSRPGLHFFDRFKRRSTAASPNFYMRPNVKKHRRLVKGQPHER